MVWVFKKWVGGGLLGFLTRRGRGSPTTPPAPVSLRGRPSSKQPSFDAYAGLPPQLLKQAEANAAYVAIYLGWVEGELGFMIGTSKSPREIPRDIQKYNKRPTGHILLWTPGQEIADHILAALRAELRGFLVRGLWYDGLPHQNAIQAVRAIARKWNVWIASTEERDQMLQKAVARAIEQHKQLNALPTLPSRDSSRERAALRPDSENV